MTRITPWFEPIEELVRAIDEVRARVVQALAEYIELSTRMRTFEEMFRTQVLHPGGQLQEIIRQRSRLEVECNRIRSRLERGDYRSADEVDSDVRAALMDPDAGQSEASPQADSWPVEAEPGELDGGLDDQARRRIVRDFKRIVLPAVHADTSETPFEVFDVAHSAYKNKDYVLMEAFVIRYSDKTRPISREQASVRLSDYRSAARRLDRRLELLKRSMTASELRDPQEVQLRMERRNQEFQQAIDEEAERLLELRRRLERLLANAHDKDWTD